MSTNCFKENLGQNEIYHYNTGIAAAVALPQVFQA